MIVALEGGVEKMELLMEDMQMLLLSRTLSLLMLCNQYSSTLTCCSILEESAAFGRMLSRRRSSVGHSLLLCG
jgi:hypothetical protein